MTCNCCENKSFWSNVMDYVDALLRWQKAGKPTRTEAEILERWEICKKCKYFQQIENKPWRGRCGKCGCYIGRHAHRLLQGNKIAMRTETCPEKKWS